MLCIYVLASLRYFVTVPKYLASKLGKSDRQRLAFLARGLGAARPPTLKRFIAPFFLCRSCRLAKSTTTAQSSAVEIRAKPKRPRQLDSQQSLPFDPSLGSFHFITSDDLPIRLDDSSECKKSSSIKRSSATPNTPSRPSRVTFLGSFLHHLRRLKSFAAKSFLRRHNDRRPNLTQSIGSLKVEESNIRQDNSRLYHRVDACDLTVSALSSICENEPTPSTRASSAPPSPSWLSRNVGETPEDNSVPAPPPLSPLEVSTGISHQPELVALSKSRMSSFC